MSLVLLEFDKCIKAKRIDNLNRNPHKSQSIQSLYALRRHCQSKLVYFAKTSEPDFVAIDFPGFFRVDLSGSMAAPSI